jgi:hypothetical protein
LLGLVIMVVSVVSMVTQTTQIWVDAKEKQMNKNAIDFQIRVEMLDDADR